MPPLILWLLILAEESQAWKVVGADAFHGQPRSNAAGREAWHEQETVRADEEHRAET